MPYKYLKWNKRLSICMQIQMIFHCYTNSSKEHRDYSSFIQTKEETFSKSLWFGGFWGENLRSVRLSSCLRVMWYFIIITNTKRKHFVMSYTRVILWWWWCVTNECLSHHLYIYIAFVVLLILLKFLSPKRCWYFPLYSSSAFSLWKQ
jgi:hypothetical protein